MGCSVTGWRHWLLVENTGKVKSAEHGTFKFHYKHTFRSELL